MLQTSSTLVVPLLLALLVSTFQGQSDGQTKVGVENMMASFFGNVSDSILSMSKDVMNSTKKILSSADSKVDGSRLSTFKKEAMKRLNETQSKLREIQQKAMNAARAGAKQLQSTFSSASVAGNGKATASVALLSKNGTVYTKTISSP